MDSSPVARCTVRTEIVRPCDSDISIRPAAGADAEGLRSFLAGLSMQTAYRRFFSGLGPISNKMLTRLLPQDRHQDVVVALHDGEIVAHAMYVRVPGGDDTAELAVVVADAWQRRGLGPRLVAAVLAAARDQGIRGIQFSVLADNQPAK